MKKLIVVTGGAGFVGSNLINFFLKKTNFKIISIDNYSSGLKKNHIPNKRIRYKNNAGDYCEGVIPDPIPNSEVKPFCADGTLS